ncbi:hypothetical protein AAL_04315 [Moelleriella libera RCEF 2490]|uniref:Uncharacterized protein n=1 Tax=Moelleriella libera RCEF 2490 TaxID=1081109 RepID=A0A168C1B9_9HYPO|nr:hypothetical protein AAL_04315 [Moelleriella libera RCEF 2490]
MAVVISPPDQAGLLAPILPALPAAAASTQPASQLLPLLSPVLRQRVRAFADSSTEPWLRLLCWDAAKATRLAEIARGPSLEPHPVSGEVEIDWGYDAETRYKRLDEETLQALVVLSDLGLAFKLEYCVNDSEGGGDGWRIGEVTLAEQPSPFSTFSGVSTIAEAERQFRLERSNKNTATNKSGPFTESIEEREDGNDEDDDYWARYDATPARTPAQNRSPAPVVPSPGVRVSDQPPRSPSIEDEYFSQYDDVQPAMDNHDPDEEAQATELLGRHAMSSSATAASAFVPMGEHSNQLGAIRPDASNAEIALQHPRPESSASSNGSKTVAKLEETAGKQAQSEFGVKQHVSRSIRSLYMLSRTSGIDREEFERLVKTELDLLGMMDEGE